MKPLLLPHWRRGCLWILKRKWMQYKWRQCYQKLGCVIIMQGYYLGISIVSLAMENLSLAQAACFFAGNDFPPIVDRMILPDKTVIDSGI